MKYRAPLAPAVTAASFLCLALAACGDDASTSADTAAPDTVAADSAIDSADPTDVGADTGVEGDGDTNDVGDAELPDGDVDAADASPPREHGLEARVPNLTCAFPGKPPLAVVPVALTPVYAELAAPDALAIVETHRADGELAVVERGGRVRRFGLAGTGGDAATVVDLASVVGSGGLRGAAFRPDGGALLVSYVDGDGVDAEVVLARLQLAADGTADPALAEDLLSVPVTDAERAGGALAFLLDGTLAVALGDGGDPSAASDPSALAGKVLRLDVRGARGSGYTTPTDNPYVGLDDARPEVWAAGLGAPTSCAVDRVIGRLWCGDAGSASDDFAVAVSAGVAVPLRTGARAGSGLVVGALVRDAALPDIQGVLVSGDRSGPDLAGLRFDGALVRSQGRVATLPAALVAFGEDPTGRVLVVSADGHVHALVRPATPRPAFPTTVSASGCLAPRDAEHPEHRPAPGLVPYEVRAPLWSDGARKRRYFALPGDATIGFTATGAWSFPDGTIFMKEFLLDEDGDPTTPDRMLETRFIVKRSATQWDGWSYMWDRDGRDGWLIDGAEVVAYAMAPGAVDAGGASTHRHTFPDRAQCLLCHNETAGRALGLQTGRMNTDHDYDGFVENQLAAMDHIGLFGDTLTAAPDALPRFPDADDETAPVEARARAWLYGNCAHCHTPGPSTPVAIDLRYEAALADTHTCGIKPRYTIAQIPDAFIIDPGHSGNSELFFRLSRRDQNQMPPIASLIVEPSGVDVVRRWIDSLTSCP